MWSTSRQYRRIEETIEGEGFDAQVIWKRNDYASRVLCLVSHLACTGRTRGSETLCGVQSGWDGSGVFEVVVVVFHGVVVVVVFGGVVFEKVCEGVVVAMLRGGGGVVVYEVVVMTVVVCERWWRCSTMTCMMIDYYSLRDLGSWTLREENVCASSRVTTWHSTTSLSSSRVEIGNTLQDETSGQFKWIVIIVLTPIVVMESMKLHSNRLEPNVVKVSMDRHLDSNVVEESTEQIIIRFTEISWEKFFWTSIWLK